MYVSGMRAPFSKYPPGLPSLIAIPPNRTHPQFVRSTKSNLSSTRNVPPHNPHSLPLTCSLRYVTEQSSVGTSNS